MTYDISTFDKVAQPSSTLKFETKTDYLAQIENGGVATPAADAGAGLLDSGAIYKYKFTFISVGGKETEPSAAVTAAATDATHLTINLTAIPTGGVNVVQRKIYRTEGGGSTYKYLATINDNTTTTYSDAIADASLGAAVGSTNTTNLVPVPTRGVSVATAGNYTVKYWDGSTATDVVVYLSAGVVHPISLLHPLSSGAGTVVYWY